MDVKGTENDVDSPRIKSLNKAINVYVENVFDRKSLANTTMRAFIPFFSKDESIKAEAMAVGDGIKEKASEEICEVISRMEVEKKLNELDENVKSKKNKLFVGLPEKQIKQELYIIKKKTLAEKAQLVDQEYNKLFKELEEEMQKFETTKTLLEKESLEKDIIVNSYKKKISELDEALPVNFLENN